MSAGGGTGGRASRGRTLRQLAVLALLVTPAAAHDHWITPSRFDLEPGARVDLTLCVGHPGQFEPELRDPRRFVRFEALGAGAPSPVPIPGIDGKSPAGILRPRASGPCWVVFESHPAFVEIDPTTYRTYLTQEGLDDVLRERAARGEDELPGRDHFVRCDKALLRVGMVTASDFARRVGLPLELVLETDPLGRSAGDAILLRLEFEGHPLARRQIKLMQLAAPHRILLARTDAEGRARFTPDPGDLGPWVATSVHQRRSGEFEGDWDSWWASLAFE